MRKIVATLLLGFCINAYSQTDYSFVYDSQAFMAEGIKLFDDGKYKEAVKEFDKIDKTDPRYATAQYEKAIALAAGEDKAAAKAFYEESYNKGYMAEVQKFYMAYGSFLSDQKDYEKAEKMFFEAQKLMPNSSVLLYNMALLYIRQEQRQKAVDALEKAITINPHHSGSHYLLGLIALEDGRAAEGTMALLAYLTLSPTGSGAENAILKLNAKFSENYLEKGKLVFSKTGGDNFEDIDVILRNGLPLKKAYKINSTFDDIVIRQVQAVVDYSAEHKMGTGFFETTYIPWLADMVKKKQFEGFSYYILLSMEEKLGKKLSSQTKKITGFVENYLTKGYWEVFGKRTMDHFGKQEEVVVYVEDGKPDLIGKVVNGKKEGKFKSLNDAGNLAGELNVVNDEVHGLQKYFNDKGRLIEEKNYVNGKMDGKRTTYYENGNIELVENYKDDMLEGISTSYHVNGGKRCEGNFAKGELNGTYTCQYENGSKQTELTYINGQLNGKYVNYDKAGNITLEQNYTLGKRDGRAVEYYNGKVVKSEIEYKAGEAASYKSYYPNGTLTEETAYANGNPKNDINYFGNGKKSSDIVYDKDGYITSYTYYQSNGQKFFEETYSKGAIKSASQYVAGNPKPVNVPVNKAGYTMKNYDGTLIAKGGYEKGLVNGEWNYFYSMGGGPRVTKNFDKGIQTGKTIAYKPNGNIANITNYVNDTIHGVYEDYRNGKAEYRYLYKDGEINGPSKQYYPDGSITSEDFYIDSELNAKGYSYWQNGKIKVMTKYIEDVPVLIERYNPDGKKEAETDYANKNGKVVYTCNNGHEVHEFNMVNGRLNGRYTVKDKAGKVTIESDFINGVRNGRYYKTGPTGAPDMELNYYAGRMDGLNRYYDLAGNLRLLDTYVFGDNTGAVIRYYHNKGKFTEFTQYDDDVDGELKYYNLKGENILILGYENNDLVYYTKLDKDGKLTEKTPITSGTARITSAYANGKTAMEINLVKGNIDGKIAVYSAEGKPEFEANYNMGLLTGARTEYYANGKVYKKENFKDSFFEGVQEFYKEDGKPWITAEYKNDEMHGLCKIYTNGIVSQTQRYDSDSLVEIK